MRRMPRVLVGIPVCMAEQGRSSCQAGQAVAVLEKQKELLPGQWCGLADFGQSQGRGRPHAVIPV